MKPRRVVVVGLSAMIAVSCNETMSDLAESGHGQARITTSITGPAIPPGPPYFRFLVDGQSLGLVNIDSSLVVDSLEEGKHSASIQLLRTHCTAAQDPIEFTVRPQKTTQVRFDIVCQVNWGHLQVALPTAGTNQPDILFVLLDGNRIGGAAPNTVGLGFPFLPAGSHTVGLEGYGSNCSVADPNPRNVVIPIGDTLRVRFTVACS